MTAPTPGPIEIERPAHGPYRVTIVLDGRPVDTLRDLPPARGGLLFVGDRPDPTSVRAGHHRQGPPGARFWRRLVRAGILPKGIDPATADEALVAAGHGIADVWRDPSPDPGVTAGDRSAGGRPAADHSAGDRSDGVGPLWQKIALWRPAAIVLIDRSAAEAVAGRPLAEPWGVLRSVAIAGRPCILMPADDATVEQVDEGVNLLRNLLASLPAAPGT